MSFEFFSFFSFLGKHQHHSRVRTCVCVCVCFGFNIIHRLLVRIYSRWGWFLFTVYSGHGTVAHLQSHYLACEGSVVWSPSTANRKFISTRGDTYCKGLASSIISVTGNNTSSLKVTQVPKVVYRQNNKSYFIWWNRSLGDGDGCGARTRLVCYL